MKIGILETGELPEVLAQKYGDYPNMFVKLLRSADSSLRFEVYSVVNEQYPTSVDECDAWLVTGSRHGVYDPLPWIEPLKEFLKNAYDASVPIIGICFGHQILAEALGGKVEKSSRGWGLGVHRYEIYEKANWFEGLNGSVQLNVVHQDQIVDLPEQARVLAGSDFCPFGILEYPDRAISMQPHPEIETDYEKDLIDFRRADGIFPDDVSGEALETLDQPLDAKQIAKSIVNFLNTSL